jgi:hypothetical protein
MSCKFIQRSAAVALLSLGATCLAQTGSVRIEGVTLIDAVHGERTDMQVLIEAGHIRRIQTTGQPLPEAEQMIEGQGLYLLPGLWDAHVHYTFDEAVESAMPGLLLAHGVTAVRDTGGPLNRVVAWKGRSDAHPQRSPAYFFAGPLLDGRPAVYDGSAPGYPNMSLAVTTPAEARAAVGTLAKAGASLVKAYEMLQPEVLQAIIAAARQHAIPVSGHIPLGMSGLQVGTLGISSLEHLRNLELDCSQDRAAMLAERRSLLADAAGRPGHAVRSEAHRRHRMPAIRRLDWDHCLEVLNAHHQQGVIHVPTLALILSVYEKFHTGDAWRATFNWLPDTAREDWLKHSESMGRLFLDDPGGDADRSAYLAWVRRVIHWMADKQMLMAGTDAPLFFMTPGASLHKELEVLVQAGLSPMQAIEAATRTPARYFGLGEQAGTLAVGQAADLLLLDANPLEDIRNTRAIRAVIRGGRVYDRAALDALLEQARTRRVTGPQASPG